MNEPDFIKLNEHLKELKPIFDAFCLRHGFAYVSRTAIGRYPRVRIERSGPITLWFDLWMELDENGRRYEQFRHDLPYELSSGAYIDALQHSKHGIRYQISELRFSGKPFAEVGAVLLKEMEDQLQILDKWDDRYLLDKGIKVELRASRS